MARAKRSRRGARGNHRMRTPSRGDGGSSEQVVWRDVDIGALIA